MSDCELIIASGDRATRSELVAKSWAVNMAGCRTSCSEEVNTLPTGKQHAKNVNEMSK